MGTIVSAIGRFSLWLVIGAVLVVGVAGCDEPAVKAFKEHQRQTMTPHGQIDMDSVTKQNEKIEYLTADGKRWRIGFVKRGDGTFQFDEMPERMR